MNDNVNEWAQPQGEFREKGEGISGAEPPSEGPEGFPPGAETDPFRFEGLPAQHLKRGVRSGCGLLLIDGLSLMSDKMQVPL